MTMLKWNAHFNASSIKNSDDLQTIILRGVLIDSTVNENGWQIEEEDLDNIATQSVGTQLRLDHSDDVTKVKGKILTTELDYPHAEAKEEWDPANENVHVHFSAEMITNDPNVIIPVTRGYVDHVSIGADAETVYCSVCGKPTRPVKKCSCNSHDILKNIVVKEYSIITNPAYKSARFMSFAAAVDDYLKEGDIIVKKEETKLDDGKISVTSETTNINYYYADKTPEIEVKASEEVMMEEVVEEVIDNEKIIIASDETTKIMASTDGTDVSAEIAAGDIPEIVNKVLEPEIRPEPKDTPGDFVVNVNKDKIKDPGIQEMMAKEEKNMEEDIKKEEVEASIVQANDVAELLASVKDLVASLNSLKAEAEEEKKEDIEVKANDGYVTEDRDVSSGNPVSPVGTLPAPVEANPQPTAPKTDVLPVKTPAMSASAGMSAGLIGATADGSDVESRSIEEIFSFAANKMGWSPN